MIIVFGASGFIGSNLSNYLASQGHHVLAVVRPLSDVALLVETNTLILKRLNPSKWANLVMESKPTHVICAQWSGVAEAIRNDSESQFENIDLQLKLATACIEVGSVETFTAFGSQAEIGPNLETVDELVSPDPQNEYGRAKVLLYASLNKIFENQNIRFLWFRVFSIFGPGDRGDALIPTLVTKLLRNENLQIKNPELRWSSLPVQDLTKAVTDAIFKSELKGIINVGNQTLTKIEKICKIATSELEEISGLKLSRNIQFSDVADRKLAYQPDSTKLESIGWVATKDISMSIKATVDWEFKNRLI
jgi:nucleoside-diphosphate-sugar epimerase